MVSSRVLFWVAVLLFLSSFVYAADLTFVNGYLLDPNWYSPHRKSPPPTSGTDYGWTGHMGWGLYEYGIAGNINGSSAPGFADDTDIYGLFGHISQPAGVYTLGSWDVWWRSAYVFNRSVSGPFAPPVALKLHANMWTYALLADGSTLSYYPPAHEFGQTFVATGKSITLIRALLPGSGVKWKVSIHEDGPNGAQVGPTKTVDAGGNVRLKWNGCDAVTVPGNMYYVKFRAFSKSTGAATAGIIAINDPIPDMSDPMPEGCMYVDGVPLGGDKDLALTICSDDDGILTNLFLHKADTWPGVTSAGQTFVARGTSLISFCAWLPQSSYTYVAMLYNGVGGTQIGTAKLNRVMRGGDPEVMWLWNPGECSLTPGNTYYIEVTREDYGGFAVMANRWNEYVHGQAYAGRVAQTDYDLCGTIMEEESPGSATKTQLEIKSPVIDNWPYKWDYRPYPVVLQADRTPNSVTIRWETFYTDYSTTGYPHVAVPSDALVEYSEWTTPYTDSFYDSTPTSSHAVTLTDLKPNTLYHFRVRSAAQGCRPAVSRDLIIATTSGAENPNLLVNPGFEDGSLIGDNPNARSLDGWSYYGSELKANNGLPAPWRIPPDEYGDGGVRTEPLTYLNAQPYAGNWHCEGAICGSNYNGLLYQRVQAQPGVTYNFTCAISSWMRESGTWKYDEWEKTGRLDYLRIGIDPTGGTDPNSSNVQWTSHFYSHLRYNTFGTRAVAQGDHITAFIQLVGIGGYGDYWHLYGVDDCRLTAAVDYQPYELNSLKSQADGAAARVADLIVTATPAEAGAYYAQTQDRSQGIRVESSDIAAVGQKVTVAGTLQTKANGERCLTGASFVSTTSATEPKPLMMLASAVGGSAFGTVPAMPGSKGPHNTALAVKVAGVVTVKAADASYVFISDGSLEGDGIKVDTSCLSSSVVPNVGDVVSVSGISSAYVDGTRKPVVIARRASDISADFNP